MRKLIAILIMIGLAVFFYFYVSNLSQTDTPSNTRLERITNHDLTYEYPNSPREVIVLFNQILAYIYSDHIVEDEVEVILLQQRKLMSDNLLSNNPFSVHQERVISEIKDNKENRRRIIESRIQDITPDSYFGEENEFCRVKVIYYLAEENRSNINVYHEYTLEKDENSRWKILGWEDTEQFEIVGE
ncbi:hypothetical protein EDC19_2581 [Natranaerovirga hydrolytica]|uniref:DUF4829 domain-containing protein n=1 Tax=Natranaerovirga hydrolytica TaxID=680378 RepID=A0A4R1MAF4_9FIRM|nr:DUF6715 family protein [Natranaerovirga hydrolytica]TCK87934.1 hypothetical protein EDC19_2581 [Natranaerovirga hydrolytica]